MLSWICLLHTVFCLCINAKCIDDKHLTEVQGAGFSGLNAGNEFGINSEDQVHGWTGQLFYLILYIFVLAHCLFIMAFAFSSKVQSWVKCVELLYKHGRTYFAAATLMNPQRFLDTAAMYALFRVADDYVDTTEGTPETRSRDLEQFMDDFWYCWENKRGEPRRHIVLPAVIDACIRNDYPKELFERFFKSMMMDMKPSNICKTWEDTIVYMEGSAAVIGDFMIPILMSGCSHRDREVALPGARDLGNAFQLTNMIRDMNEDLDLKRQYIPEVVCEKWGIDLHKRTHKQGDFAPFMEDLFDYTDKFYKSADLGIEMLPSDVRHVIRVARILYHRIHDEIRMADYDIFSSRARVSLRKKVRIATQIISIPQILRIIITEFYFCQLKLWISLSFLFVIKYLTNTYSCDNCSYGFFHFVWTLPMILSLTLFTWKRSKFDPDYYGFIRYVKTWSAWVCMLSILAFVYTTPWDNYLVKHNVWGYGNDKVIGKIFYVPLEEYSFFILETVLLGLFWLNFSPSFSTLKLSSTLKGGKFSIQFGRLCLTLLLSIFFYSSWCLFFTNPGKSLYLFLILAWGSPVLAFQCAYGYRALIGNKSAWVLPTFVNTWFLAFIDEWAIKNGIWSINQRNSLGYAPLLGFPSLPLEEFIFFLVTSLMCSWGLTLFMVVSSRTQSKKKVIAYGNGNGHGHGHIIGLFNHF